MNPVDKDIFLEYLQVENSARAEKILSILGKTIKIKEALEHPAGNEILGWSLRRMEYLLERVITEQSTPEERAEYRVLRGIVGDWTQKLNAFSGAVEEVKATVKKAKSRRKS